MQCSPPVLVRSPRPLWLQLQHRGQHLAAAGKHADLHRTVPAPTRRGQLGPAWARQTLDQLDSVLGACGVEGREA
eukprot:627644-Rhodomonas_salina.1